MCLYTSAVDYLLKPIRKERLLQGLQRARVLSRGALDTLKERTAPTRARTHLSAPVGGSLRLVPVDEVLYFQADQKYVTVVWTGESSSSRSRSKPWRPNSASGSSAFTAMLW